MSQDHDNQEPLDANDVHDTDDHHHKPVILRSFVRNEILFTYDSRHEDPRATTFEALKHTWGLLERFKTQSKFDDCQITIPQESIYVIERQNRASKATPRFFALVKVVIQSSNPSEPKDITQDTTSDVKLYQHIDHMVETLLQEGDFHFPFLNRAPYQAEQKIIVEGEEDQPKPDFWNYEQAPNVELALRAISPNWLTGAAAHANGHSITGGPGKPPEILAKPSHNGAALQTTNLKYKVSIDGTELQRRAGTRRVRVFILDADITPAMLLELKVAGAQNSLARDVEAALKKGEQAITNPPRWASDKQKIASALSSMSIEEQEYGLCDHELGDLSQHGLFIAGVIHTLAPNAEIHVLSAMNKNGAGSTESIIACLETISRFNDNVPNIINTSLSLAVAAQVEHQQVNNAKALKCAEGDPIATAVAEQTKTAPPSAAKRQEEIKQTLMREWLHSVPSDLSPSNTVIIAAAGNDSSVGQRLEPRYPARYNDVIGVAATEANGGVALYSNRADISTTATPATYGTYHTGAVVTGFLALGEMNGLYLRKENGVSKSLAKWAGTSFAAAITSGVLAALLTEDLAATLDLSIPPIEAALKKMEQQKISKLGANGYTLSVTQG